MTGGEHRVTEVTTHVSPAGEHTLTVTFAPDRRADTIDAAVLHPDARAALLRWLTAPAPGTTEEPSA